MDVGDRVKMLKDVYEDCDDLPPKRLAAKGEVLEVRRAIVGATSWTHSVAHVGEPGSFWVTDEEIEKI